MLKRGGNRTEPAGAPIVYNFKDFTKKLCASNLAVKK